jgi:hypothetical protein
MSWELLENDRMMKTTELSDYTQTEFYVPEEYAKFFGNEGERLALIYKGREYPAYVETAGGNTRLNVSKVLIKKFGEAFPHYASWFEEVKEPEKTPRMEITKAGDHFDLQLLIGNDDQNALAHEKSAATKDKSRSAQAGLGALLTKWIDGYPNYYPRDFRFSFKDVINEEIPEVIEGFASLRSGNYQVKGFAGDTQWAEIPWVMVTDKRLENSLEDGLHLAYLLAMDSRKIYLAVVYAERGAGRRTVAAKVEELRQQVDTGGFNTNLQEVALPDATLVSGLLCYREYTEEMPADEVLEAEFERLRKIYDACVRSAAGEPNEAAVIAEIGAQQEPLPPAESSAALFEPVVAEPEAAKIAEVEPHRTDAIPPAAIAPEAVTADHTEPKSQSRAETPLAAPENEQEPVVAINEPVAEELAPENKTAATATPQPEAGPAKTETPVRRPELELDSLAALKRYPVKNETLKPYLQLVLAKMVNKGFIYSPELIKSYYLCLKSKPFVMIQGYVGSGKTSLPRLFAETIGATSENGRFLRVLVGKNWEDEKQLFGYLDNRGHFIPGPIMVLLKSAKEHPEKPHFLLLDEMDRSPAESYLHLLLEGINGNDDVLLSREDFGADVGAFREYGLLRFPDNLYIVGTVNQGPESYPLAPRVIDSGNTLEMPVAEISVFPNFGSPVGESQWENDQFKMQSNAQGLPEIIEKLMLLLSELQQLLIRHDQPIGYRGKNEILAFGINSGVEGLFCEREVIDLAIVQRILPALKRQQNIDPAVYRELACFGLGKDLNQRLQNEKSLSGFCQQLEVLLEAEALPCPRSGRQIIRMLKRSMI